MAATYGQRDPTAVVGRRVLAFLIDVGIGWAVNLAAFFAFAESTDDPQTFTGGLYAQITLGDEQYFIEGAEVWWPTLIGLGYAMLVYVLITGLTGATPGKALAGIRVVRPDGSRPGIGRAFVRWLLLLVDAIPYFIPMLVGFITALSSQGHRRLGDMAAGTYVVRRAIAGQPVPAASVTVAGPL